MMDGLPITCLSSNPKYYSTKTSYNLSTGENVHSWATKQHSRTSFFFFFFLYFGHSRSKIGLHRMCSPIFDLHFQIRRYFPPETLTYKWQHLGFNYRVEDFVQLLQLDKSYPIARTSVANLQRELR